MSLQIRPVEIESRYVYLNRIIDGLKITGYLLILLKSVDFNRALS